MKRTIIMLPYSKAYGVAVIAPAGENSLHSGLALNDNAE